MRYNIPDRVLRDITLFAKENNVERVILFGSRAKGTHTERSDIDIAVQGGDFDSFYWRVREDTHSLLMFDIVDLNGSVSSDLKNEIADSGVTIYEKKISV